MIHRCKKTTNFTCMLNYHLQDQKLSFKAKGMLSYLLSLPDNWKINLTHLATVSTESIDATRSCMRELIVAGYIERKKLHDKNGRILYEYIIDEHNFDKISNLSKGLPHMENPAAVNPILLNTNKETYSKEYVQSKLCENESNKPIIKQEPTSAPVLSDTTKRILDYWNNKQNLPTHKSGTKTECRANKLINKLITNRSTEKSLLDFIDWYDKSLKDSFCRFSRFPQQYRMSLPETLELSDFKKKSLSTNNSTKNVMKGVKSLFDEYCNDRTDKFFFEIKIDKDSKEITSEVAGMWESYCSGYSTDFPDRNQFKSYYAKINKLATDYFEENRDRFQFGGIDYGPYNNEPTVYDLIELIGKCIEHQHKKYKIHWICSPTFFHNTLTEYLVENDKMINEISGENYVYEENYENHMMIN